MFWIRRTQVINLTVVGFLRCFGLVLLSMLPFGCIEEVEIPIAKGQELLVVDGRITNECGPHVIHITRSARYGDVFTGTIRAEQRAQVIIRDSRGGRTALAETIPWLLRDAGRFSRGGGRDLHPPDNHQVRQNLRFAPGNYSAAGAHGFVNCSFRDEPE